MPLTVAPPPRNGDAAQGRRPSDEPDLPVADPAGKRSGAPEPAPTLPTPAAVARTMAAGVLLSAAALGVAATIVFVFAAIRLAFAGDVRLTFDGAAPALMTCALAIACAATLAAPIWPWPARRPATLALATIVTAAWPLSGLPFPAAVAAIVAVGLALFCDHHFPAGARVSNWMLAGLLALIAAAAAIAGAALADAHPEHPTPRAPAAPPVSGAAKAPETPSTGESPAAGDASPGESPSGRIPVLGDTPDGQAPSGSAPAHGKPPSGEAPASEAPAHGEPPAGEAPSGTAPAHGEPPSGETPAGKAPSGAAPAHGKPSSGAAPAPVASEAPKPSTRDADGAAAFVRAYYTAIDEQRFDDAWAVLTPALRSRFGGFERWKAGYETTLSNAPKDIVTTTQGDRTVVRLRLAALEQGCPIARNFSVTWTLGRAAGEWTVRGLRASADASSCG